jgi:uncharacterized integral membrane protein (TIGR00698 family)
VTSERTLQEKQQETVWPGVLVALGAALVAVAAATQLPSVSPLLVAILLGVLITNTMTLPSRLRPGLTFASKPLLRWGIVLLGLRISLEEIVGLGWKVVAVAVMVVVVGMTTAWIVGGALKLRPSQRLLIGAGFSICGAAAIAAVEGSMEEQEPDEVLTALALVVVYGTVMIPVVPLLAVALTLSPEVAGVWAGASIHEVAQVVAAGGIIGAAAMQMAVIVKLIRVLMLAPVVIGVAIVSRLQAGGARRKARAEGTRRPPLVPLFALGFIGMVIVRSVVPLPAAVLSAGHALEAVLLSAAMFALGCGVHRGVLRNITGTTLGFAAVLTTVVAGVGLTGALLAF